MLPGTSPVQDHVEYDENVSLIRQGIIGEDSTLQGCGVPLATKGRKMLYTDFTASGRCVDLVERYMLQEVMPYYGNTHTVSSGTARQTTNFRNEARSIIKNYYNCTFENALIFTGNGATGATSVFVKLLQRTKGFTSPPKVREEDRWGSVLCTVCGTTFENDTLYRAHAATEAHIDAVKQRKVAQHTSGEYKGCMLLLDPMSHHTSILPYRELVKENPTFFQLTNLTLDESKGHLSVENLTTVLERCQKESLRPVAILSAASNVTGIAINAAHVNTIVHAHGGVALWDLAAVAGHMRMDLNPPSTDGKDPSFDFAIVSPHKLLGGPGTTGLLFAKKILLSNETPCYAGGGIVQYVSPNTHTYIENLEEREEAGTPNILGCIKAGLVYRMHSMLDPVKLHASETAMLKSVTARIREHKNVKILGDHCDSERVGILSFNIVYGGGLYLHHNFVTVLLNDLFGIQVRGGCACAGPYAQWLLGMSDEAIYGYEKALKTTGVEVLRPGFVRTGVHFTMTSEDIEAMTQAILWVADHGWKLLGAYVFHRDNGEWEYKNHDFDTERKWISSLTPASMRDPFFVSKPEKPVKLTIAELIAEADKLLEEVYTPNHITLNTIVEKEIPKELHEWIFFATQKDFLNSVKQALGDVNSVRSWEGVVPATDRKPSCWNVRQSAPKESGYVGDKRAIPTHTGSVPTGKKQKKNHILHGVHIPKSIRGPVGEAIKTYNMINEGDNILVGLSGGKDSMVLLHVLLAIQKVSPVKFKVGAATVNPMTPEYDPTPLVKYVTGLGVEYAMLSQPLIDLAKEKMGEKRPSICSFCSRMKRGMLYSHMRKEGYNVLALGQHSDDLVESFVMSLFHNGMLTTMKANYTIQQGDVRVIRPLVLVRERMTAQIAKENNLPLIQDNCPACFAAPKERHRIKVLLSGQEAEFPSLFPTIMKAIKPLIAISETDRGGPQGIASKSQEDDEVLDQKAEESLLPCTSSSCPV
eukprot:TRINITY_DN4497_c0_g2_i11.p1 TRINITY_DN4497_c0_g2~~TRINITY_DN4497_c0_g2_i11.p1  ORF type:complete len:983 (+),score=251.36 TRINITY_DN4497_c0_g2_i11:46-2994(+)